MPGQVTERNGGLEPPLFPVARISMKVGYGNDLNLRGVVSVNKGNGVSTSLKLLPS